MATENALWEKSGPYEGEIDFDELERRLEEDLNLQFSELDMLIADRDKISNPESLGDTVMDVIWEQFLNQIAVTAGEDFIRENRGLPLDLRNEAHIQTTENFANGKIARHNYISRNSLEENYDRYKNMPHKQFRKKYVDPGMNKTLKRAGDLKKQGIDTVTDIYTGRKIPTQTKLENGKNNPLAAQREHVKPSGVIYQNASLQMANNNEELANIINDPENLQGYTTAERNNRKSDNSSNEMDERDKTKHWEKADKRAEEHIKKLESEGEERLIKEGRKTQKEEAFRITGKALQAALMQLLAELVKSVISKLVSWIKSGERNLESFFSQLKAAVSSFVSDMKKHLLNIGDTLTTTIATSIFGPIVRTIKKVFTLLKQGARSIKESLNYIRNPYNRNKPVGILMLEVGKIIMAGVSAAGAIVLGEVIEKGLMAIPVLAVEIPLLGSLASILGMFMGALVSGIIGAIALNLIDKAIAKKQLSDNTKMQIAKRNDIIYTQDKAIALQQEKLYAIKEDVSTTIRTKNKKAGEFMKGLMTDVFQNDFYEELEANEDPLKKINSFLSQTQGQ